MTTETIGEYEIDYSGAHMADVDGWAAWVAIYGPSANPMHRNSIVPAQRVALEQVFDSEAAATEQARLAALAMLDEHSPRSA